MNLRKINTILERVSSDSLPIGLNNILIKYSPESKGPYQVFIKDRLLLNKGKLSNDFETINVSVNNTGVKVNIENVGVEIFQDKETLKTSRLSALKAILLKFRNDGKK